ncbi:hypothetical protein SM0020_17207 [Sinorhizobium meliloti CCNWSX0020]|uniref:Uncharacterized protein n=1 Tax=Sinorhizobium meliloti CCNWSX0020 TaxID=1107881 RepID=H0G1V1_RHIML|nr:hypothetical protein SM0020_17207 [Sinorhizobium meliloti CCNWSX0020]
MGASRHGVGDGRYHAGAADGHLFAIEPTVDVCLLVLLFAATVAAYAATILLLMIDPDRKDRAPRTGTSSANMAACGNTQVWRYP